MIEIAPERPANPFIAQQAPAAARTPHETPRLLEKVFAEENVAAAWKRVRENNGCAGCDGIDVAGLTPFFCSRWSAVRERALKGEYRPQPLLWVGIAKPAGGTRVLGVPTVVDRVLLFALHRQLAPLWEANFSTSSYGYRPGRGALAAVSSVEQHLAAGANWVVHLDIKDFFDSVVHRLLMFRLQERITDERVLNLVRRFLKAGIVRHGVRYPTHRGVPQGSPLSPLLANIVLDELDQQLERRHIPFVRYADDCALFAPTEADGRRWLQATGDLLVARLGLHLNKGKCSVLPPAEASFLGFCFVRTKNGWRRRIAPSTMEALKWNVQKLTALQPGQSKEAALERVGQYLRGNAHYYGIGLPPVELDELRRLARRHLGLDNQQPVRAALAQPATDARATRGCDPQPARGFELSVTVGRREGWGLHLRCRLFPADPATNQGRRERPPATGDDEVKHG